MKKISIVLAFVVFAIVFYKYGRSIYMPIVTKILGKETCESIIKKIEDDVWNRLELGLGNAGYKMDYPRKIVIVAFKEEQILQVYSNDNFGLKLIKEYPFSGFSGKLGPKLKNGDKQIPEGIYKIEHLNPNSSFYLSIKINYPNEFDQSKSNYTDIKELGNDIFIHGKSSTVGCIPLGDEAIEEVFLLVSKAFSNEIKVIISPRDFRKQAEYPEIAEIDWEDQLYDLINEELKALP